MLMLAILFLFFCIVNIMLKCLFLIRKLFLYGKLLEVDLDRSKGNCIFNVFDNIPILFYILIIFSAHFYSVSHFLTDFKCFFICILLSFIAREVFVLLLVKSISLLLF